jgi:hypothetical protein
MSDDSRGGVAARSRMRALRTTLASDVLAPAITSHCVTSARHAVAHHLHRQSQQRSCTRSVHAHRPCAGSRRRSGRAERSPIQRAAAAPLIREPRAAVRGRALIGQASDSTPFGNPNMAGRPFSVDWALSTRFAAYGPKGRRTTPLPAHTRPPRKRTASTRSCVWKAATAIVPELAWAVPAQGR